MAERRMFAKTIIDSDAFIDMPVTARLLYYDLSMRADDDGFVNSPKKIMRMIGASQDDMAMLIMKKFIIPFDNGIVVIKHWRIHNYIRKDMYHETKYKEQKELLALDENNAYTLNYDNAVTNTLQVRDEVVTSPSTQDRLGKDRIGKDRIENTSAGDPVEEYTDNPDLQDAIRDFIKMRKVMKKPMTGRAMTLMLNKLRDLSDDENEQIEILNQSIEHNWQSVYPLDKKEKNKDSSGVNSHEWDYDELAERAFRKALEG